MSSLTHKSSTSLRTVRWQFQTNVSRANYVRLICVLTFGHHTQATTEGVELNFLIPGYGARCFHVLNGKNLKI